MIIYIYSRGELNRINETKARFAYLGTYDLRGGDLHCSRGDAEVSRVVCGGAADAAEKRLVVLHERLLRVVRRARVADVRRARQLLLAETGLNNHSILLRVPLLR